ncbi:magnesium transporter CorA family protein [Allonocardiopsis opalescens]|uniref:Magnesium transporter n=1 Tax=Allonocardiopsis opalescens TaxID=1144618 RepID=A0A2T0Q4T0_9ACTN|nr:magnesium transporter CorA family protein [Allonocardiopsis opalescens]PRX98790.1 magnesium transporter [Allonocardiopsis opalescens]
MARTRLYGTDAAPADFPLAQLADRLAADPRATAWADLDRGDDAAWRTLSAQIDLHDLARSNARLPHRRPGLAHYRGLLALDVRTPPAGDAHHAPPALTVLVGRRVLVTVRDGDAVDLAEVVERWQGPAPASIGGTTTAFLLHALLDWVLERYHTALRDLDERAEDVEGDLFAATAPPSGAVQRRCYAIRRSLLRLRRGLLPLEQLVDDLQRHGAEVLGADPLPYYRDLHDRAAYAVSASDALREMVVSVLDTDVSLRADRTNIIVKRVTGWAAIIAVPTALTGFFGMNVPYPGTGRGWGVVMAVVLLAASGVIVYAQFKRRDWL